jgi:hypothetical protein
MKVENYICYNKQGHIYSLGMELNGTLMKEKFSGGGKPFLRRNLGVPLSLFLLNRRKDLIDDFLNDTGEEATKSTTKSTKATIIKDELLNKLIKLRANPVIKKKNSRKKKIKKIKKIKKHGKIYLDFKNYSIYQN